MHFDTHVCFFYNLYILECKDYRKKAYKTHEKNS